MPSDDLTRLPALAADESDGTEVIEAEIVDADETADPAVSEAGVIEVEPERRRSRVPGLIALLLAVATAFVSGVAIGAATAGDTGTGTVLGTIAIGLSLAAILVGAVAAIARLGRAWGVAGIVVGVIANPWLQLVVLRFIAGE